MRLFLFTIVTNILKGLNIQLVRYWFEFKNKRNVISKGVQIGCGVTAFNYTDAILLIREEIFMNNTMPAITNCIENVDIRTLDQGHVIPNMSSPSQRGIWFPLGYHDNN